MSKKTALDLVCEDYVKLVRKYVPIETNQTEDDLVPFEQHVKIAKDEFKRLATISDGWDVVKEIYQAIRNINSQNAWTITLAGQLKDKLEQAGIEVE